MVGTASVLWTRRQRSAAKGVDSQHAAYNSCCNFYFLRRNLRKIDLRMLGQARPLTQNCLLGVYSGSDMGCGTCIVANQVKACQH